MATVRVSDAFKAPAQPELVPEPEPERAYATDFEARYIGNAQSAIKSEQVREFLQVPPADVLVETTPRQFRTASPTIPQNIAAVDPSLHVQDCILSFTKPFTAIRYQCGEHGGRSLPRNAPKIELLPKFTVAEDDNKAFIDETLLQQYSADVLRADAAQRQEDRLDVLDLMEVKKYPEPSDRRPVGTTDIKYMDYSLSITLKSLDFPALGEVEPFFITLTLYDLTKRAPISESFCCSLSNPSLISKLSGRPSPPGTATQSKTATFRIAETSKDIFLVIRLEKVLQGDTESATAIYYKTSVKPKEKAKFEATIASSSQRLGTYTQSFGMGVLPLFKDDNSPLYGDILRTAILDKIVRLSGDIADDSLFKNIKSLLAEKFSKFKVYPASLNMQLKTEKEERPGKLTPTLVPILPEDPTNPSREIQEFHTEDTALVPHSEWVNSLYLYPQSLNLSNWSGKGSARNLSVQISVRESDSDPISSRNLPLIYGQAFEPNMKATATTSVSYHAPKTVFNDEIKICLPPRLTPKHHIFFTVNHINVRPKSKKEKPEDVVAPVAYAVLPLLTPEGKLIPDTDHFLSTAYNFPPSYLAAESEDSIKFVEKNRKPNFIVRTKLVSTVNTLNDELGTFFSLYDQNIDSDPFRSAIAGLRLLNAGEASKWCNVIITALCRIMSTQNNTATVDAAFQSMMFLVDTVSKLGGVRLSERNIALVSFVNFFFEPPPGQILLFDVLIESMVRTLAQKNAEVNEIISRHNWFAFDLIIKTMTMHLHKNQKLDESVPRADRFGSNTNISLAKLVALTLDEVILKPNIARVMSENLAWFLKDLFSIYDRGLIMDLVYLYQSKLPKSSVNLKFEFLRIICDYEHYVQLNLPLPDRIVDIPSLEMTLWTNHFLAGILANEIITQVRSEDWIPILTAVDTMYFLFLKHSRDPRYQHILAKTCIPGMYFTFVLQLADANDNSYRCVADAPWAIRAKLLSCFLWIVKNTQRKILQQWWSLDTQKRITSFFVILANCIGTFEYQRSDSGEPELLKSTKLSNSQAVIESRAKAKSTLSGSSMAQLPPEPKIKNTPEDINEQNLSREVNLIVLDLLMDFMNDNVSELRKTESPYMDRIVINLLTLMLRKNQCLSVLVALFAAVRHTIVMFPGAFFVDQTPFGGEISYAILRHCNSPFAEVRAKASAIFYLLLRNNFLAVKNFSRMKLQSTIAVSRLVGDGTPMVSERFNSALREVSRYAQEDTNVPVHFRQEVVDLTERLFTALANSIKIAEFSFDPEMTADLYYDISRGYVASPDLRAAWLQNLAAYHETHNNHEEAAQCQIHLAALISVYINQLKPNEKVPVNPIQFQRSAPNSYHEMQVPKEAFEEEGICQSSLFTRNGMYKELKSAVNHLKQDSIFESCIAVQRLNIEVLKENRNYQEMGNVFGDLEKLSDDILSSNESNSRLFSNYYLVRFYGLAFQDLNGTQFIYKERQMTRLADLSSRLVEQFKEKFGECKTLAASASTDGLDPNIPYVMTLTVKPYFSNEEICLKDRQSAFERQFNIKRFIFETPMTTTGAKYSEEITEQAKKKTILETDTPFPFVIKRLRIVSQSSEILSPIETSTELIEDRCRATQNELEAIPPNPKTLQIILQGSVLLQVNAGPLAIAKTFLGNRAAFDSAAIGRLEKSMQRFVDLCGEAVKLNKTLIGPDQMEFQNHLEKGFESLNEEFSSLVGPSTVKSATK